MTDNYKRTIAKTISWRVAAVLVTFTVTYFWTGRFFASVAITIVLNTTKAVLYYSHERIWNDIKWGKQ